MACTANKRGNLTCVPWTPHPFLTVFVVQEVIDLTKDLLTSQPTESASTTHGSETVPVKLGWKVGDKCMAVWSQDGQWVSPASTQKTFHATANLVLEQCNLSYLFEQWFYIFSFVYTLCNEFWSFYPCGEFCIENGDCPIVTYCTYFPSIIMFEC